MSEEQKISEFQGKVELTFVHGEYKLSEEVKVTEEEQRKAVMKILLNSMMGFDNDSQNYAINILIKSYQECLTKVLDDDKLKKKERKKCDRLLNNDITEVHVSAGNPSSPVERTISLKKTKKGKYEIVDKNPEN